MVAANRRKDEELTKVRLQAERDVDAVDRELRAAKLDSERKDKRLEMKQRKIEALQKDVEDEKKRYELASKDGRSNETMMNKLKAMLDDQEQVMSLQDSVVKEKEDEISDLNVKLQTSVDKCQVLQKVPVNPRIKFVYQH